MLDEELTREERMHRIQAMREVTRFMNTEDYRERIIEHGFGNGVPVIAAFEDETLESIQNRMRHAEGDRIVLGIVYPERSPQTIIPQYRRIQIILWERKNRRNTLEQSEYEDFHDISPKATVGMFCDYLWQNREKKVMIPDFAARMEQFMPSTKRALVMA